MKPPQIYVRRLHGFVPANEESQAFFERIALGDLVTLDGKRPRSLPHLRKYWAMCAMIAENTGFSSENVHSLLKQLIGHGCWIEIRGRARFLERPTNFNAMDQIEFEKYYNRCVNAACAWMGVAEPDLADKIAVGF